METNNFSNEVSGWKLVEAELAQLKIPAITRKPAR
jgi:hypothetical protein